MAKNNFTIEFESKLKLQDEARPDGDVIISLPNEASEVLPSKGMVVAEGKIDSTKFITALEPDGKGGHILRLNVQLFTDLKKKIGDKVTVSASQAETGLEPSLPSDLKASLSQNKEAEELWKSITPLARREWIHWISSAKQANTRARRIEQTSSKLLDGKKRPCCFDNKCAVVSYEPIL